MADHTAAGLEASMLAALLQPYVPQSRASACIGEPGLVCLNGDHVCSQSSDSAQQLVCQGLLPCQVDPSVPWMQPLLQPHNIHAGTSCKSHQQLESDHHTQAEYRGVSIPYSLPLLMSRIQQPDTHSIRNWDGPHPRESLLNQSKNSIALQDAALGTATATDLPASSLHAMASNPAAASSDTHTVETAAAEAVQQEPEAEYGNMPHSFPSLQAFGTCSADTWMHDSGQDQYLSHMCSDSLLMAPEQLQHSLEPHFMDASAPLLSLQQDSLELKPVEPASLATPVVPILTAGGVDPMAFPTSLASAVHTAGSAIANEGTGLMCIRQ